VTTSQRCQQLGMKSDINGIKDFHLILLIIIPSDSNIYPLRQTKKSWGQASQWRKASDILDGERPMGGKMVVVAWAVTYYWPAYTQCRGGSIVLLSGVCSRLSSSVTLHGEPAGGFTRAGQTMTSCRLQSNYSSMVTLQGGPLVLHPVRATLLQTETFISER